MHVQGIAAKTSRWQVSVTSFPHATSKPCCVNVNECAPPAAAEPEEPAWAETHPCGNEPAPQGTEPVESIARMCPDVNLCAP